MNLSELEARLALAELKLQQHLQSRRGDSKEFWSLSESVKVAEREFAAAKGEPYAVPYEIGFTPESAVPEPVVLQTETFIFLTFSAVKLMPEGNFHSAGYAIIEFDVCSQSKFGYPNDEALDGHPLCSKGLDAYGVYEVINSAWVRLLTEQNRVSFPNTPDSTSRHFIFTFHDSTFECIARSLNATLSQEPFPRIFEQLVKKGFGSRPNARPFR